MVEEVIKGFAHHLLALVVGVFVWLFGSVEGFQLALLELRLEDPQVIYC